MNLEHICKNVEREIERQGMNYPFALALVGSRSVGYANENSDYDFLAICEKEHKERQMNFLREHIYSVNLRSKEEFEQKIKHQSNTKEQNCLLHLPYKPLINNEYLENIEEEGRRNYFENFLSLFPKDKKTKINLRDIAEYPLIRRAITIPEYTNRLRRINSMQSSPIDKMSKKYIPYLEKESFEIEKDGTTFIKNNKNQKKTDFSPIKKLIEKINNVPKKDLDLSSIIKGGLLITTQVPFFVYNSFEKFPVIEDKGNYYEYRGPSIDEFLKKRKSLSGLENYSKKLKDEILYNILTRNH